MHQFAGFYRFCFRFHKKIASGHYAQVKLVTDITSAPDIQPSATNSNIVESDNPGFSDSNSNTLAATTLQPSKASLDPDEVALVCSADPIKDQTYFLCNLRQEQLRRCLFPIGHLLKTQVRQLASEFGLPNQARRDSQGICFLGKVKFSAFLEHYLGQSPGPIRDPATGAELGRHLGLWFHNIGQRTIGKLLNPLLVNYGPWAVCGKDVRTNTLFVSNDTTVWSQQPRVHRVAQINWINGVPAALLRQLDHQPHDALTELPQSRPPYEVKMKVRHSPLFVRGRVLSYSAGATRNHTPEDEVQVEILGEEPVFLSPGQFVVFYEDDGVCIGAGKLR